MLKPTAFANAASVTGVLVYVICRLLVAMMPDAMFNVAQSWMHSVALQPYIMDGVGASSSWLVGLISMAVVVWLVSYVFAALYNTWSK